MTPYVQREIFRAWEQIVLGRATRAVSYVGNHWGNELRCHELARAVWKLLDIGSMSVVDGMCGPVEHTWLELIVPIAERERGSPEYTERVEGKRKDGAWVRKVYIDVYVPGRLPQVQLIDSFAMLKPLYTPGESRGDINFAIVEAVYDEMRAAWIADLGRRS